MDADTIAGVVKAQVESPRPGVGPNPNPSVTMPAGLVSGEDLDDVATYVADVAGKPGIKGPQLPNDPGAQVFADNQCSGCHTLATAGAKGTTGPDLDQKLPGMSAAEVTKSIVDPNAKISPGYPPNVMPDTFGKSISSQDLKNLVSFMLKYAKPK
jgi:mono/diheme cytochrome c family protein